MADSPDVRVRLSAEGVDEVVRALEKIKASSQRAGKDGGKGIGLLNDALGDLKGLLPALGIAGAVSGIFNLAKSAVEGADQMSKLSKKTGISVESLSVLGTAADLADVGMEGLSKGLKKMSVSLYELETGGGGAADGFRQIGLTAKDLKGLKPEDAFVKISNAVAKLPPGMLATNATMKIFGKTGNDLIPMMQDLANGGFETLRAKLERTGQIMSTETAAKAEVLMDEMKLLEKTTKASALALASGMLPALLDVTREMQSSATETRDFSQSIGKGLGLIIEGFYTGSKLIGAFAGAMSSLKVGDFRNSWNAAWAGFYEVMDGPLNQAIKELPEKVKKIREEIAKLPQAQQGEQLGKLTAAMNQGSGNRLDLNKMVGSVDLVGKTVEAQLKAQQKAQAEAALLAQEKAIKMSHAMSGLAQADASNQLSIQQAKNRSQQEAEKELYDRQIVDLEEYYRLRGATIEKANADEIAKLQKDRKAVAAEKLDLNDESAAINKKQRLAVIDAQIESKRIDQQTKRNADVEEERKAIEDLGKRRLEIEAQILEAQGKTYEAALIRIRIQADELKKSLGRGSEGKVGDFTALQNQQAQFQNLQRQGGNATGALDAIKGGLDNQVAGGALFPFQAVEKYQASIQAMLPTLQALAQAQRDAAVTPEEILAAEEYANKVDALAISADKTAQQMALFKQSVETSLTSNLTNFFTTGIQEAENFGDAMRGLALSVVDSLRQIAAQMLATYATQQLLAGAKAVGSFFGYADGGLVQGHADGGFITGPGTGTSDSIPARLSDGEFVVRSAVVRQPGVLSTLIALNQGAKGASVAGRGSGVPRFADGGLVTASEAMGSGLGLEANFGLDEGVISKKMKAYLKSPDGQRVQIENLSVNKKKASSALGR